MHRFGPCLSASLFGLVAAVLPASGQSTFALSASPERALARAADTDGSGDVSAEERATFVASFKPAADGSLDRREAAARIVRGSLDTDGDGLLTGQDAAARLASLDADGSGTLEPAELAASIASSGRARGLIFDGIVGYGADLDGNGTVDGDEWRAATVPAEGEIDGPRLLVWVTGAERGQDDDINSFGPATLLATLRGAMDANRDGAFRLDDVEQVFADLDTNGDGGLSAEELALPRRDRFGGGESEGPAVGDTPLMPWQRTLDDALALVAATGKPLLVCVNMDGEAASEALARRRYRDPEFAKLAGGFIPVLASPNRHNPRDYDDDGRRIPDPRFGRLIDSEHIDIEPIVFERYFRGERVAPRHVGVSAAGEILFDLYLLQDLRIVDRTLEKHGRFDVALPDPATLDEAALLASPDAAARDRLEGLFLEASTADQVRLLGLALHPARTVQHPSLLRMGLRSSRPTVRQKALEQYVANGAATPIDLYPALLLAARDFPQLEPALRAQLAARVDSAEGNEGIRARRLSRIFEAVEQPSAVLDVELWRLALAGAPALAAVEEDLEPVYEALARLDERVKAAPGDARLNTLFAQLALRGAQGLIARGTGNPSFLLQDAQAAAQRAVEADPSSSLAWAYLASSSFLSSDFDTAGDAAAKALPGLVDQAGSRLSADVLVALASSRTRSLYPALGGDEEWPASWVREILGAYEVLLAHPMGTEAHARGGLDVMTSLEVYGAQSDFLRRALERFPTSGDLHNYYRWQVLRDEGAAGLLEAYADLSFGEAFEPTLRWYEGLADFVAAERLVRDRHPERALAAYEKSIEDFEASMELEESFTESASHYLALAWSGIARLHLDSGLLDEAVSALHQSAKAGPGSFTSRDGLENTPSGTARELMTALKRANRVSAADALGEYLDSSGVSL